jgi:hypothetical protein
MRRPIRLVVGLFWAVSPLLWSAAVLAETCGRHAGDTWCSGDSGTDGGETISGGGTIIHDSVDGVDGVHDTYQAGDGFAGAGWSDGDGGDVTGPVDITVNLEGSGDYRYWAAGGSGGSNATEPGEGGNSPDLAITATGEGGWIVIDTMAGSPGILRNGPGGSFGGFGGGGVSGNIEADIDGSVDGISLQSAGFHSSGDVTATVAGSAGWINVYTGTFASSYFKATGPAGDVTLSLEGTVSNDVSVASYGTAPGTVHVTLADGAVVDGTIINWSSNAEAIVNGSWNRISSNGVLTFAMSVQTQAEYDEIASVLGSSGASGTATVNGHVYSWEGFDTLENLIRVIEQQHPGEAITVTIGSDRTGEPFGLKRKASQAALPVPKCDSNRIIPVRLKDGRIQLNLKPTGGRRFLFGWIDAGTFTPTVPDYAVKMHPAGNRQVLQIAAPDGTRFATCTI